MALLLIPIRESKMFFTTMMSWRTHQSGKIKSISKRRIELLLLGVFTQWTYLSINIDQVVQQNGRNKVMYHGSTVTTETW